MRWYCGKRHGGGWRKDVNAEASAKVMNYEQVSIWVIVLVMTEGSTADAIEQCRSRGWAEAPTYHLILPSIIFVRACVHAFSRMLMQRHTVVPGRPFAGEGHPHTGLGWAWLNVYASSIAKQATEI